MNDQPRAKNLGAVITAEPASSVTIHNVRFINQGAEPPVSDPNSADDPADDQ